MSSGMTLKKAPKSEFSRLSNFTMAVGAQIIEEEYVGLLLAGAGAAPGGRGAGGAMLRSSFLNPPATSVYGYSVYLLSLEGAATD